VVHPLVTPMPLASTLIRMKRAALSNARQTHFGTVSLVVSGLLGLATAASTLLLGFTAAGTPAGGADQLALLLLTWTAGRVGFAAFAGGDAAIPLDMFRFLPAPRRALARALLVVGFTDAGLPFLVIAFAGLVALGFRHGAAAGIVGMIGTVLSLLFVSVLSTIVAALVPSGSRRRQDIGTLLAAGLISAIVVAGSLAPTLLALLATGNAPAFSLVLRILPTGWAPDAVALTATGHPIPAVLTLVALAVGCAALVAWWPKVLTTRLLSSGGAGHRGTARTHHRLLPATPTGAVTSRELRLWIRDPTRAGYLLIALLVGLGACLVPLFSSHTSILLPFAGLGTIVIAAAIAGNSYGFDGAALAIVLTTPHADTSDVRGRQLAWLLLVGPYGILLTVAGLLVAGEPGLWPWVLGLLPATLGGGAGIIAAVSLLAVQPLDDSGGPTVTWVLKAYVTIILTALATTPTLALLIVGTVSGATWLSWIAVPVGVLTGLASALLLGKFAETRLARRGPEIFQVLATATSRR
jgi:ABC-2 type transport system permease protein